jgi:ribosomal protein S18 acetylase RimI-like enzyme
MKVGTPDVLPRQLTGAVTERLGIRARISRSIWSRAYEPGDEAWVFEALSFLPQLYPGGHAWLDRRLHEVLDNKARCTIALFSQVKAGVLIEAPKAKGTLKISTIWVEPRFRHYGAGAYLLEQARARWIREGLSYVYVTADLATAPLIQPLFQRTGFTAEAISYGRYGEQRDELVLSWRPD